MAAEIKQSPAEMQVQIGGEFRRLRLSRNFDQRSVSIKAGVSVRALRNLEIGGGSSIETMCRVLKALDAGEVFERLVPRAYLEPVVALMRHEPQRASKSRRKDDDED